LPPMTNESVGVATTCGQPAGSRTAGGAKQGQQEVGKESRQVLWVRVAGMQCGCHPCAGDSPARTCSQICSQKHTPKPQQHHQQARTDSHLVAAAVCPQLTASPAPPLAAHGLARCGPASCCGPRTQKQPGWWVGEGQPGKPWSPAGGRRRNVCVLTAGVTLRQQQVRHVCFHICVDVGGG
jgi:hypothetical protein